ncbi:MAG: MOSC domain-containing protein [Capsulimonadales bacterium]|nr:MOSC domain-containing protein [Capsulimonadales bacterium]
MMITELNVYPIKGCHRMTGTEAVLDEQGLVGDRRWMLVRATDGRFLTQREVPLLARVWPTLAEDGLTVRFEGRSPLFLPPVVDADLVRRNVTVWGFTGETIDEGEAAAAWFSEILGFGARLVRTPNDFTRRVQPAYARPNDRVGFADGFPLLLANMASLDDLNARLLEQGSEPVPMIRFRPNIVVSGASAWAEDHWRTLTVEESGLTFRVAKPCARCAVTTIDQETGERTGPEPLAILARFRRDADGKVNFATNLIHDRFGPSTVLRVGETLRAAP